MSPDTDVKLSDEDMETRFNADAPTASDGPQDADGTDGDATDATDGDAGDGDAADADDGDATDADGQDA